MLIVYIIILTLFIANIKKFIEIFLKNGFVNSNFKLNTFVEPILRVFDAYKYKTYDIKYDINQ
jgi:hypothetical protein